METFNVTQALESLALAEEVWIHNLRPDPGGILLVVNDGVTRFIPATERFELVSSLFGPGNIARWFFLLLSVVVSWTLNPSCARKDSITNDFVAALFMPAVAAVHFFHQVYQQNRTQTEGLGLKLLLRSLDLDNVRLLAGIEAPLTVCEDFLAWAPILYFLAARKGHLKRMFMVMAVGLLCLSVETLFMIEWVPFESSLHVRPFIFHFLPLAGILRSWQLLIASVYFVDGLWSMLLAATKKMRTL